MLSRRKTLMVLCLLVALAMLAACAPPTPKVVKETVVVTKEVLVEVTKEVVKVVTATPVPVKPRTLTHWQHHSEARARGVEQFKAEFEAAHPGVTIEFQSIPWGEYWDKLYTAIAAGKGPDVFQIPMGLIPKFIASGYLVPVDESVVTAQQIESEYIPWVIERLKSDGKYYGLPVDVQTFLLFCNDALFEEAGLDPKKRPADWDELYANAVALTKKPGGVTEQVGIDGRFPSSAVELFLQQALAAEGLPMVDPDTMKVNWDKPAALEAFRFVSKLYSDADDRAFLPGESRFLLGKAGMIIDLPVLRGVIAAQAPDMEYTIHLPPPPEKGGPDYTVGSHWAWVVSKTASDPYLAWEWVRYCTNRDAQLVWYRVSGDLPSMKDLVDDPSFRLTKNDRVVMDSMKVCHPVSWIGWPEWDKAYTDAIERVAVGGVSAEDSLSQMIEEVNAVIAEQLGR